MHGELGYQRCALVLGIPESWVDVSSVSDLAEVATELRGMGRELRVATKYTNLTRQYLYDRGVTYFSLVEVSGAIEAAPSLDTADVICDLTSSGVTLRENRLKTIAGGTVLESQACLIGNRRILGHDPARLEATCHMLELIEASLRSRQHLSLTANIRGDSCRGRSAAGDGVTGQRRPARADRGARLSQGAAHQRRDVVRGDGRGDRGSGAARGRGAAPGRCQRRLGDPGHVCVRASVVDVRRPASPARRARRR